MSTWEVLLKLGIYQLHCSKLINEGMFVNCTVFLGFLETIPLFFLLLFFCLLYLSPFEKRVLRSHTIFMGLSTSHFSPLILSF